MVQRFIFSFLAVLCGVGIASAQQMPLKQCFSQAECDPNECCAKRIFHPEAYCVSRRKLNEICINDGVGHTLYNGLYDITCPCEEPLMCLQDSVVTSQGQIITRGNPRCRLPNYTGFDDYAYANSGSSSFPSSKSGSSNFASSNSGSYSVESSNSVANSHAETF